MISRLYDKVIPDNGVVFNPCVTLLSPVGVAESGRVCQRSEFKVFDISASLNEFTSSDFSIQNLESIGALAKLKTTYMSNMHDMNIADKFENYQIPAENVQ